MWAKAFAVSGLALALAGCTAMTDSASQMVGIGVLSKEHSTFDGATIVQVSPAFLYAEGSWGNQVKLGARWSSAVPDKVALDLAHNSNIANGATPYLGLTGIDINIDGAISSYSASTLTNFDSSAYNTVSKTIYTESTNSIVLPYSVLERMVSAKDCRLRIRTSKGYEDAQFSIERIPGGQGTAILSIRKFLKEVEGTRQASAPAISGAPTASATPVPTPSADFVACRMGANQVNMQAADCQKLGGQIM